MSIPQILIDALYNGKEEVYLEYKGDVAWIDRVKKLEIVQTIFALANEKNGGIIIIGVEDNGDRIGLTEENFGTFFHDTLNQYLSGRGNQNIECKVSKFEHKDEKDDKTKNFVFIQVAECREFPLVYIGNVEYYNPSAGNRLNNIALHKGALYIRNKANIGNKEIEFVNEWQELIERTYKKFDRETHRRLSVVDGEQTDPYNDEISI